METPVWTLQDRIRKAREHANFNQAELADKLGVSKNSVNRWETGERNPSQKSVEALAEATGVAFKWIMDGEPQNSASLPDSITLRRDGDVYKVTHDCA